MSMKVTNVLCSTHVMFYDTDIWIKKVSGTKLMWEYKRKTIRKVVYLLIFTLASVFLFLNLF